MNNFDWLDYDESPVFKQGIAIVRRNGKFGAVMVGGREIFPPIYDDLSEFKDGYAVAKWNGEERVVNLSGQVQVLKGDKEIFLPEEYEWGFDFIKDICVVVKNDKYGIIDQNFNVRLECEYDCFSNYHNGYAIFGTESSNDIFDILSDNFLIDNDGKVSYKIKKTFTDGHKIVCSVDAQQNLYGVMDSNMQIIIPIKYTRMNRLKNGFYVGDSIGNIKSFFHPSQGYLISEKTVDSVYDHLEDLNQNFFVIYQKDKTKNEWKTNIYTSPDSLQFCFLSQVRVESDRNGCIIFDYNNNKFKYDSEGNLYIISTRYVPYPGYFETVVVRKVKKEYLNFIHKSFPITSNIKQYEIIENEKRQKGISDLEGNIMIEPQYNDINSFTENLFIVSNGSNRKLGVVDISNSIKIPFDFNSLIKINEKFLAYTDTTGSSVTSLPSYKSNFYFNTYFGIIDINGNKITEPLYSSITIENLSSTFIVGIGTRYGVVNTKGQCILECKYDTIEYNEHTQNFIFNISCEKKSGIVSIDGFHLVKDAQEKNIKIPATIVDWCSDFNENNIANVIKNGYSGYINKLNQFVSFVDGKELIMPSMYDFIKDFTHGYAPVLLQGKFGIVNSKFNLIVPCEYEYIEALSDNLFKFREGCKWGLIDICGTIIAKADYVSITVEAENLLKIESFIQNGSSQESRYGFLDNKGNTIIPAHCRTIKRVEQGDNDFFIVEKTWEKGVLDKNGKIIVPFIYSRISVEGSLFYCYSGNISSVYNVEGEHLLYIDDTQYIIIPTEYEYAQYADYGLIQVSKAEKWGLIDIFGQIIVETKFANIDKIDGSFARVGVYWDDKKLRYGLIDTSGEIVLPLEYEEIEKWDNGYYIVRKDGLYGLLSPTLHIIIEPSKQYLKKINNKYIVIKVRSEYSSEYMQGLIDYYGNEIISAYENFSEVTVLENGFLKVIYNKSQYKGCSCIGILNPKGRVIYKDSYCDDITYIKNGLFLIEVAYIDRCVRHTYNIVNIQGKKIFNNNYDYIEILENGNFLINKNGCYGMAKNTGQIFIHPKYTNKIKFENGFAEIKVNEGGPTHKINENGQVIVSNDKKNEILLPKEYYWGTDFINGISIVRSVKNEKLGVINKQCNVVVAPEFDAIDFLSDNTFQVKRKNNSDYYYGLYDINGKCIFPAIFTEMEYLDKNRIRVIWNINETQSWSPGKHTPGPNKNLGDGANYLVNNRSALCDAKGNIINDKNLAYVGEFHNGYAKSYLTTCIENHQAILKQSGIIDIDGETIVSSEYDRIILYVHNFALLRKGDVYGLADLKNKKTILFSDINIKKPGTVDSFGRFIYTDGDYDQTKNKGVIGPNGIILPSGKYSNIELLENGLIKVSNEEHSLYGLLDLKGKELLKMEYTFISSFMYGYATVCIDGHYEEDNFAWKLVGGKWGIIDKTGKFIVKCIHNEKQKLSAEDIIKYNLIDDSEFDSHGRLLINEWDGNMGVIGLNSIIVPMGKYSNIQLLDNGLIKVSNNKNTFDSIGELYGLLDSVGKELLEMKYSYISKFKNGYASICIGGHDNGLFLSVHVGGKWGVIDKAGKIVVECIHDEEQLLTTENIVEKYLIDKYGNKILSILCSDHIPVDTSNNIDSDYYDNYCDDGYDDDTPSIYDNPYYNDNLDMDQQSIEFWNSF